MKKKNISQTTAKLLLNSHNWKVVSSAFKSELPTKRDKQHLEWLKLNTDSHQHREHLFILKGTITCSLNGKCYQTSPGALFLFNHFETHDKYYSPFSREFEHLWVHFLGKHIILRIIKSKNGQIKNYEKEYIISKDFLFTSLKQAWDKLSSDKFTENMKRKYMTSALSLIFLDIIEQDFSNSPNASTSDYRTSKISMIKEHIKETAGAGLTIDILAHLAGYSKFHFLRIFKENTGMRVHEYINKIRLKKVNEMLKKGYMKKEISYTLGFSCPAAFTNWHKKLHK